MSFVPRRPDYVYGLYGSLFILASTFLDLLTGDRFGSLPFDFSLLLIVWLTCLLSYFTARYNERNPLSPIRLWLRQCYGSLYILLIGAWNCFVRPDYRSGLFLLMGVFVAASGGYYYVKDRSRIHPSYYDRDSE
jgi:hypothetical protein